MQLGEIFTDVLVLNITIVYTVLFKAVKMMHKPRVQDIALYLYYK